MAQPATVIFGPSGRADRWWALLPSTTALHADTVTHLISDVEQAMARDQPGRPFTFVLDLHGSREPGERYGPAQRDSAAQRMAERRLIPLL
jgi:hypothetical protein